MEGQFEIACAEIRVQGLASRQDKRHVCKTWSRCEIYWRLSITKNSQSSWSCVLGQGCYLSVLVIFVTVHSALRAFVYLAQLL